MLMEFTTYHLNWLINKVNNNEDLTYLHFWGHQPNADQSVSTSCFSQWWHEGFEVNNNYYATAEHWMMAQKAILFNDPIMLEQILAAETPYQAKKLGRLVKNFDPVIWDVCRFDVVCEGNFYKFSQNNHLKNFLINTEDKIIAEASPRDRIWGIGMGGNHINAKNPQLWKGKNLLGFALMEVRDQLKKEII